MYGSLLTRRSLFCFFRYQTSKVLVILQIRLLLSDILFVYSLLFKKHNFLSALLWWITRCQTHQCFWNTVVFCHQSLLLLAYIFMPLTYLRFLLEAYVLTSNILNKFLNMYRFIFSEYILYVYTYISALLKLAQTGFSCANSQQSKRISVP